MGVVLGAGGKISANSMVRAPPAPFRVFTTVSHKSVVRERERKRERGRERSGGN